MHLQQIQTVQHCASRSKKTHPVNRKGAATHRRTVSHGQFLDKTLMPASVICGHPNKFTSVNAVQFFAKASMAVKV